MLTKQRWLILNFIAVYNLKYKRLSFFKCNYSDVQCHFKEGDSTGSSDIRLHDGMITEDECIEACLAKNAMLPNINGVTISKTAPIRCWCKLNMVGWKADAEWKSCRILPQMNKGKNHAENNQIHHLY